MSHGKVTPKTSPGGTRPRQRCAPPGARLEGVWQAPHAPSRQDEGRRAGHRGARGQAPDQALMASLPAPLLPGPRAQVGLDLQVAPGHQRGTPALCSLLPDGSPCPTSSIAPHSPPTAGESRHSPQAQCAQGVVGASGWSLLVFGPSPAGWGVAFLYKAGGMPITSPDSPQGRPAAVSRGSHLGLWPRLRKQGAPCGGSHPWGRPCLSDVICGLCVSPSPLGTASLSANARTRYPGVALGVPQVADPARPRGCARCSRWPVMHLKGLACQPRPFLVPPGHKLGAPGNQRQNAATATQGAPGLRRSIACCNS